MTPIADRLNEYTSTLLRAYLAQFDKPEMALNLQHGLFPDRQLAHSGIVPTTPIQLLNNILTEGDDAMTNHSDSTRVRIYSHITQSRFLHVEDSLNIGQGKLRLFGGIYRKGEGMSIHSISFLDLADARVIFGALARGEQGFAHKEYKGTPPRDGSGAVSRVLSIAVKGDNVYIELKNGPGKLTNTGAITPNGPAKAEVNVGFKLFEARRMAASVLAYIHAWDVMRMMVNQQMVSPPTPYASAPLSTSLLVSTISEITGINTTPANGVSKQNGATRTPVVAADNGRPVTRKTAQPAAAAKPFPAANSLPPQRRGGRSQNGHTKENGNGSLSQVLLYGDGTPVAADNQTERTTYARYQQAKGMVPPSKGDLQQFYQQQVAV